MKIALFIILTVITFCLTQRNLTDTDRQRVVSALNTFRASRTTFLPLPVVGSMRTITWNTTLENSARASASRCAMGASPCGLAGQRSCSTGENVFLLLTTSTPPVSSAVIDGSQASWTGEHRFYDYFTNSCLSGRRCTQYTLLVKDTNNGVGCAIVDCPNIVGLTFSGNKINMVCHYNAQNVPGVKPYTAVPGSTPAPTTVAATPVPTTAAPTGPTFPPAPLQPVASNVIARLNAHKKTLGQQPYLVNNRIVGYLQDFTKRQAAAGSFLATEISPFYQANRMGGAWCYTNCRASTCNEDFVVNNWLMVAKLSQVQNAAYLYIAMAHFDDASGTRWWTVFWHTSSGNVLDATPSDDSTLDYEGDN